MRKLARNIFSTSSSGRISSDSSDTLMLRLSSLKHSRIAFKPSPSGVPAVGDGCRVGNLQCSGEGNGIGEVNEELGMMLSGFLEARES